MEKIIFSFILAFTISLPTYAQDLLSIYKLALQNDSQFRAAQAEYHALLELKNQSVAAFLPTISASANYTEREGKTVTTSNTNNDYTTNGYSLNLTQPLYRHANYIRLEQSDAQIAQASAVFENAKQDLILRVATQYFAVLAAEDDLEFAKSEKTSIAEQLEQTRQRFNVGLIAITDVHEAQARYDQAVASAIVAQNTLAISNETLREITSKNHSALSPLSVEHPLVSPEPADIRQWVDMANNHNALLTANRKDVEVAQAEVSRQSAGHYPTLDLTASYTYTDYDENYLFGGQERTNNAVSLQLNIPLYQGGNINSLTRAAAYRLTQTRETLEQQKRATNRQTRSAYLSVIANISQVKALKQALVSSLIASEATQAGFEVGTRTAVDVLNSQRDLFRARRDYAQARYNYVLETLKLKFAAGTLSATDIEQLNPWLK